MHPLRCATACADPRAGGTSTAQTPVEWRRGIGQYSAEQLLKSTIIMQKTLSNPARASACDSIRQAALPHPHSQAAQPHTQLPGKRCPPGTQEALLQQDQVVPRLTKNPTPQQASAAP